MKIRWPSFEFCFSAALVGFVVAVAWAVVSWPWNFR